MNFLSGTQSPHPLPNIFIKKEEVMKEITLQCFLGLLHAYYGNQSILGK